MQQDSTLEWLLDRQRLSDLVDSYCRAVDRRDFALLRQLYDPSAIHDHGSMFNGAAPDFVAWLEDAMRGIITHHFVGNRLFRLFGDEAEGEIYTINMHVIERGGDRRDYIAGGRYLDRYRRADGGWHFTYRKRLIDWTHERPSSTRTAAAGMPYGAPDRTDPSYDLLSRLVAALP